MENIELNLIIIKCSLLVVVINQNLYKHNFSSILTMKLENLLFIKESLGKEGKPVRVYKLKTMRDEPESENAVPDPSKLDNLGKIKGDSRITKTGRILRKLWIDELPQLINLAKGEMSLVGIRPRRAIDWMEFPISHKEEALKYKPGLLGVPYAYLETNSFEDLIETERKYLERRRASPNKTQIDYFWRITKNILFNGARGR